MPETRTYVTIGHLTKDPGTRKQIRAKGPEKMFVVLKKSEVVDGKIKPSIIAGFLKGKFVIVKRDDGKYEFKDFHGNQKVVDFDAFASIEENQDFGKKFKVAAPEEEKKRGKNDETAPAPAPEPDGRIRFAKGVTTGKKE